MILGRPWEDSGKTASALPCAACYLALLGGRSAPCELAAWPAALRRSAPPATLAQRPTL